MKKLIKPFIIFCIVLCLGLILLNQYKDRWAFHNPTVGVQAEIMVQNPETGEYELAENKHLRIAKDKPYTYEPAQKQYYDVNAELSTLYSESVHSKTKFIVYYECQTCVVRFESDMGTISEGSQEITIRKGQTITNIAKFSCDGYEQIGYDKEVAKVYEDSTFKAQWQLREYNVYLHVAAGSKVAAEGYKKSSTSSNCYVKSFNFTQTFELPELEIESTEQIFNGWYDELNGEGERWYEIEEGMLSDVHLYASYDIKTYELTFMLDDKWYSTAIAPAGEKIYSAGIPAEQQIAGMGLNWYADEECETLYKFDVMPQGGITVYGKWEEDIGEGFIGWSPEGESIDSFEELLKYVHYVRFYNLTDKEAYLEVTYCSWAQLESDIDLAIADLEYRTSGISTCAAGNVIDNKSYVCIFMEYDNGYEYEDLESTQRNNTRTYDYFGSTKGEREGYTDFYIESLPISYEVETTIQLQYVVERGYRPICKPYSPAQKVYAQAKKVLNEIIDVDFNDYEKVQAIYDWFVLNIQYDFNAVEHIDDWPYYDSHYMEGVFYNQKAVCDGIAKAFSLMCNIEGIPALEVGGTDHAWNKVKINNEWYAVDATHGRVHLKGIDMAMMTHEEIFISDAQKAKSGYVANEHPNIVANGSYDYFGNKYYTYNGETHDYVIENAEELAHLLMYISDSVNNLIYLQIDFKYQVEGATLEQTFLSAVQILDSMGINFGYKTEKIIIKDQAYAHVLFA